MELVVVFVYCFIEWSRSKHPVRPLVQGARYRGRSYLSRIIFLHSSLVSFIDGREHNCLHEKCCDSMATIVDEKLKSKNFKPQM